MNAQQQEMAPLSHEMRVLMLPATAADGQAVHKVLSGWEIQCDLVRSLAGLCRAIPDGAGTVLISDEHLLTEPAALFGLLAHQEVWSDLPILVLSAAGRQSPELERVVGRLGNVSLIDRPVQVLSLVSLIRSSLRARRRQYQVREYLAAQREAEQRTHIERERLLESERAARSEAERAGRMKDEFLATLGHELRTPLNAVLGWSQILRRSRDLPREVLDGLAVIERNGRSQAQIIEGLLDMSAIVSGKIRLELQKVNLSAVIDATINSIRPTAEATGVRLEVVLDPQVPAVNGDPGRLQQVFWNLLANAVKFTRESGLVLVKLERVDSHAEVSVTDDGEGIDPAFLPHVFDRFRQADASSTRRHGGLGLGLSIVKQLVELHGGKIVVESAGVGQGATFRVRLPLTPTSAHRQQSEPRCAHQELGSGSESGIDAARQDLRGADMLVVDDDMDARALVRRLLTDCNAVVRMAGSAAEALDQIQLVTPDVLISDIGMPDEDGYALIRRIRALKGPKARIPAIALTAYARADDRAKAIQAGYQRHLAKPVEPSELLTMVVSLLKRSDE